MKRSIWIPLVGLVAAAGLALGTGGSAPPDSTPVVSDVDGCLSCHAGKRLSMRTDDGRRVSLYVDPESLATSAHSDLDCAECHTEPLHKSTSAFSPRTRVEVCGSCHEQPLAEYQASVHGQGLLASSNDVATCVSCHSTDGTPHSVQFVASVTSPVHPKQVAQTCATCHGNAPLMFRYGISEKVYSTYMQSFHGKAMRLATFNPRDLDKATCTTCHGAHDVLRTDDAASPVGTVVRLSQTCDTCHAGAGATMVKGFMGHQEATLTRFPLVFFGERMFFLLTTSAVGFGILMVGLHGLRSLLGFGSAGASGHGGAARPRQED